jgi:hypothetical protein
VHVSLVSLLRPSRAVLHASPVSGVARDIAYLSGAAVTSVRRWELRWSLVPWLSPLGFCAHL